METWTDTIATIGDLATIALALAAFSGTAWYALRRGVSAIWRILQLVPRPLLEQFVTTIVTGIVVAMVSAAVSSRIDQLETRTDENFVELDSFIRRVIPSGAVIAFDAEACPTGWVDHHAAAGRFIVGVGRHSEYDLYGDPLEELSHGLTGGRRRHKLSPDEMPMHTHEYIFSNGYDSPRHTDISRDEFGDKNIEDQQTSATGADVPHENMPPYLALRYCRLAN